MTRVLSAVAWPYANGPRHIGHVAGFGVPSDVFSRYSRMAGHEVLMLDGALLERGAAAPLTISVAVGLPDLAARIEAWAGQHEGVTCRLAENMSAAAALASVPMSPAPPPP